MSCTCLQETNRRGLWAVDLSSEQRLGKVIRDCNLFSKPSVCSSALIVLSVLRGPNLKVLGDARSLAGRVCLLGKANRRVLCLFAYVWESHPPCWVPCQLVPCDQ
ncbi:mCG146960 [Mus musculus]|nr:mCG146960 [Mus musculus]